MEIFFSKMFVNNSIDNWPSSCEIGILVIWNEICDKSIMNRYGFEVLNAVIL